MSEQSDKDNVSIVTIAVDIAIIKEKLTAMADSIAVLNHNSTTMSERISKLETADITNTAVSANVDKARKSTRNWILGACSVISVLLVALNYLHSAWGI